METWPTSVLPDVQLAYTDEVQLARVSRTDMMSGRVRQRMRFTSDFRKQNVQWTMNDFQYALFQSFFFYKISGGADYFNINLAIGYGFQPYIARFVNGVYKAVFNQPCWVVTAQLEIELASAVLSEDVYDFILSGDSIDALEAAEAHYRSFLPRL